MTLQSELPSINPLESGLHITMIIFSSATVIGSILRLYQKKKYYGFYLYILLSSLDQWMRGIILFADRGLPQLHIRLGAQAAFTAASLTTGFMWCAILWMIYRIKYRATTMYYRNGGVAKEKFPAVLVLYFVCPHLSYFIYNSGYR
jgi:hypothetical protein